MIRTEYADKEALVFIDSFSDLQGLPAKHGWKESGWMGGKSKEQLDGFLQSGWDQGMAKAEVLQKGMVVPRMKTIRRHKARGDFGDALDMQAVYSGNLSRAWERTVRDQGAQQQSSNIIIAVNLTASASMSPEQFFWRGATASVLARALIQAGRNVKVQAYDWGTNVFTDSRKDLQCFFVIKDFQDVLDYNKLFTITSHAGFFRYYVFNAMECTKFKTRSSLGRPVHNRIPDELKGDQFKTILIDDIWDERQALEKINQFVKEVN